jgi:hypothetical protein
MKDGQALRLLFEIAPVRVRLSHVPTKYGFPSHFEHGERKMRREWPGLGGGDQNGKGIGAHECNRIPLVAQTKMLWDIHRSDSLTFLPVTSTASSARLELSGRRRSKLAFISILPPPFTSIFHFLGKDGLKFRQVLSLSRMSSIWLLSQKSRVHRPFRAFRSRWMYFCLQSGFPFKYKHIGSWFGIE